MEYPRDLRFAKIVEFKGKLANKIKKTHEKSTTDPDYTTFLKNFGEFKVAKIEKKEVPGQEFILDELKNLRSAVSRLEPRRLFPQGTEGRSTNDGRVNICLRDATDDEVEMITNPLEMLPEVVDWKITGKLGHRHVRVGLLPGTKSNQSRAIVTKEFPHVGMKPTLPPPRRKPKVDGKNE